jgi:hypothetical protein
MNTEYAVGNIRIHFESRARRRWLVALFYFAVAVIDLAARTIDTTGPWILIGCAAFFAALFIVFSWLVDNERGRRDEREIHRRDHAHYVAYRSLLYCFLASFFLYGVVLLPLLASHFKGPDPSTPLLPLALRQFLTQLQRFLLVAVCIVFITLPQAILLWTEPDMQDPERAN